MTTEAPGGAIRPALPGSDPYRDDLRERVLDELSMVQGRVALAGLLDAHSAKDQLRYAHASQREARLSEASSWVLENEPKLLMQFANGSEIDPRVIEPEVTAVRTPQDADLFRYATLQWSVPVSSGYGRRTRFLIRDRQNGKLMGIFALGDPVIAQKARDDAIGWNAEQRKLRLYSVYDAFVLGAVEPYRQLLAGKLAALLTISNDVRDFLTAKYAGSTTGISQMQKDPTPLLITTSSALGRSSVYNRVTYKGSTMFHSVGYTAGFGHFQFSDVLFDELREFVRADVLEDPKAKVGSSKYGSGPNWRFRVIRSALTALGIPEDSLQHNVKREVFLAPTAQNWDAFLRGEVDDFTPFDLPGEALGGYYRDRWAIGRADRRPAFALWTREQGALIPQLARSESRTSPRPAVRAGQVDFGSYSLAVGVARQEVRGTTIEGANTEGVGYMSRLEGPGLVLTIADISWANGEREIRGWDRHSSIPAFQALINRMRMGVYRPERFRAKAMTELRTARMADDGSVSASTTNAEELKLTLGFDVAQAFEAASESIVGTRSDLLRDKGPRRGQLCVVFNIDDMVTPALAWVITRGIPLLQQINPTVQQPSAPMVVRKAPAAADLENVETLATLD